MRVPSETIVPKKRITCTDAKFVHASTRTSVTFVGTTLRRTSVMSKCIRVRTASRNSREKITWRHTSRLSTKWNIVRNRHNNNIVYRVQRHPQTPCNWSRRPKCPPLHRCNSYRQSCKHRHRHQQCQHHKRQQVNKLTKKNILEFFCCCYFSLEEKT